MVCQSPRGGKEGLIRLLRSTSNATGGIGSAPAMEDFQMNIDAQDAQDKEDENFLRQKPARAMIRCGFADAPDHKLAVS